MKLVELSKTEFNDYANHLETCPFEQCGSGTGSLHDSW